MLSLEAPLFIPPMEYEVQIGTNFGFVVSFQFLLPVGVGGFCLKVVGTLILVPSLQDGFSLTRKTPFPGCIVKGHAAEGAQGVRAPRGPALLWEAGKQTRVL